MSELHVTKASQLAGRDQSGIHVQIKPPKWDRTPHEGMERPGEEMFQQQMEELARALAEAKEQEDEAAYKAALAKKAQLSARYLSPVSPDRKAMAGEAIRLLQQLAGRAQEEEDVFDWPQAAPTLIDFINLKAGNAKMKLEEDGSVTVESGANITVTDADPPGLEIKDADTGRIVLDYKNGAWHAHLTPREQAMQRDFEARLADAGSGYGSGADTEAAPRLDRSV